MFYSLVPQHCVFLKRKVNFCMNKLLHIWDQQYNHVKSILSLKNVLAYLVHGT